MLKGTPAVVTVGYRCEGFGYSFIWLSGQTPFFITPERTQIFFEVQGRIPYIRPGAPLCQPRELPPHCALCGQNNTFRPPCMPCTTDDPQTPEAESRNLDEPSGNTASQERANAPLPSEAELGKPDDPSEIDNHNNDNNHININDPSPHATVEELRNPDDLVNDDPDGDTTPQGDELG